MKTIRFFTLCGIVALFVSTMAVAQDTAAIKAKLIKLDAEWSAAATANDVNKVVSFYAPDAILQGGDIPSITGAKNIKDAWTGMLVPGSNLSWKASTTEVAKSGDMAYQVGTYKMNGKDAKGKVVVEKGKFTAIWKKQADGSWKVAVDAFSSDAAPAAPVK